MKNEKAHQKHRLIREFGILMQPLFELARADKPPTEGEYRLAFAKVRTGEPAWWHRVEQFTTFASDLSFSSECAEIARVPAHCCNACQGIMSDPALENDPTQIKERVENEVGNACESFEKYIDRIPIKLEPVVFEANTPFTAYLRISESIVPARRRLHYFDRYLKRDFFDLFLELVGNAVSIRLITTAQGVTAVAAVSKLAQQQFDDYHLIEVDQTILHDRNLRVDDQIFSLGQGVDRAGMALTNFGPSDSSSKAHAEFDKIIEAGRVVL